MKRSSIFPNLPKNLTETELRREIRRRTFEPYLLHVVLCDSASPRLCRIYSKLFEQFTTRSWSGCAPRVYLK